MKRGIISEGIIFGGIISEGIIFRGDNIRGGILIKMTVFLVDESVHIYKLYVLLQ